MGSCHIREPLVQVLFMNFHFFKGSRANDSKLVEAP